MLARALRSGGRSLCSRCLATTCSSHQQANVRSNIAFAPDRANFNFFMHTKQQHIVVDCQPGCVSQISTLCSLAQVSQGTDAAQFRLDWPRLEVPSLPVPRFIDPQAPTARRKREPVALAEAVAAVKVCSFRLTGFKDFVHCWLTTLQMQGRHRVEQLLLRVQANATAKFNETVDACIALGTNPKRGDQMVRGATTLPHGTGKEPRICVFANEADAADARAAGVLCAKVHLVLHNSICCNPASAHAMKTFPCSRRTEGLLSLSIAGRITFFVGLSVNTFTALNDEECCVHDPRRRRHDWG